MRVCIKLLHVCHENATFCPLESWVCILLPVPTPYPYIDPIPFIARHLRALETTGCWLADGSVLRVRARIDSAEPVPTAIQGR